MRKYHLTQIVIIAVVFLLFSCDNTISKQKKEEPKSIFKIPFEELQIKKEKYVVNAKKDTVLNYKTGSQIHIPQNAFVDEKGNVIKGNVNLIYREFNNAFDIYLGGIPMRYDSAGIEQVFETAGMIDINASVNGKAVFPNPLAPIQVDMISFQKEKDYNVYQLDTTTGQWAYLEKSKMKVDNYNKKLDNLPTLPTPPKKASPKSFSIGDDTGEYPELEQYKNVLFEPVDPEKIPINKLQGITGITVSKLKNGIYKVSLFFDYGNIHSQTDCPCYLAFKEGEDYNQAMKIYQKKNKSLIEKRAKMKKALEDEWSVYFLALDKYNKAFAKAIEEEEKIIRSLTVKGFGIINCDRPKSFPKGAELIAKFQDEKGNNLNLRDIVLIEKERNAIFRYTSKIKFNPEKENILWGVTVDGHLAYIKADAFKNIKQRSGEYTFNMNIHPEKLTSYDDICEVLF